VADKSIGFRPVQLATLSDAVPSGSDWIHEYKYDGYRLLISTSADGATAFTRNGKDWTRRFAGIVAAADEQWPPGCLIDGEAVALDSDGNPDFALLQRSLKDDGSAQLDYFAFDLLLDRGEDITAMPNVARKARLAALMKKVKAPLHYADHVAGKGEEMFAAICARNGEGIISKQASAPYSGRRGRRWLKIKCTNRQEFVIVGWTKSERGRGFRSLIVATRDEGKLTYAGKVGTGFSTELMAEILDRMKKISVKEAPVAVPRSEAKNAHWVAPKLVAEVAFTEFTAKGTLRHPSFIGLREDKPASSVRRETVAKENSSDRFGIAISSADRVIFPVDSLTKGDLADYYAAIAPLMLRDAARRPMTLVRCPQGRGKQCFFQKHDSGALGPAVRHVPIKEKDGTSEDYLWFEDGAGILACVQMGTIEFHGWGSRIKPLEKPDRMVFDLDPDEGLDWDHVRDAARDLRRLLANLELVSFAMLSGGKGIHVIVPLDATASWPKVRDFAERFSRAVAADMPDRFTANIRKKERKGRIFLDWLRNQRGATAVMPYSARARDGASVAAPVDWNEIDSIDSATAFSIRDAAKLAKRAASPELADWGRADQPLPRH
jgi:bifunctional non-homologous end joining protein LigD